MTVDPSDPIAIIMAAIENSTCTCEFVDIGVGWQKVAEDSTCSRCTVLGQAMAIAYVLTSARYGLLPSNDTPETTGNNNE